MMEDGWNGKVEREIKKKMVQVRNSTKNDREKGSKREREKRGKEKLRSFPDFP